MIVQIADRSDDFRSHFMYSVYVFIFRLQVICGSSAIWFLNLQIKCQDFEQIAASVFDRAYPARCEWLFQISECMLNGLETRQSDS